MSEIKKQREENGAEKSKEKGTKNPAPADAKAKKEDDKAKKEKQEQKKEIEALKQKAAEAAEKVRLRANPLGLDRYNNKYVSHDPDPLIISIRIYAYQHIISI